MLPRVVCFGSEDEGEWNGSNAGEGLSAQRVSITCIRSIEVVAGTIRYHWPIIKTYPYKLSNEAI